MNLSDFILSPLPLGIFCGLVAAICASLTYLQSQHFVGHAEGGRVKLLLLAQLIQAVVSLAALPLLWPSNMPPFKAYALPLFTECITYLGGQMALFTALRHTEASRVAPILGLKIPILGVITLFLFGQYIAPLQWLAIAMSVAAAWMLKETGGRLSWRTIAIVLTACVFYSISDLSIRITIDCLAPISLIHAALINVALAYTLCGILVLPLWLHTGPVNWTDVRRATPYALTWLTGMGFLFTCFAMVGVVLGNIVQAMRGLISILIAPLVARSYWEHLEMTRSTKTILRQAVAALLMIAAVALYVLGKH